MILRSSFRLCCAAAMLLAAAMPAFAPAALVDRQQLIDWGTDVHGQALSTLRIPGTMQFAESANLSGSRFGGAGGRAFVWPMSAQFRVQNSLARLDPVTYGPVLRQFADQLHSRYWSTSRGGYRASVVSGAERYYDDNAHLAVALAEAYEITGDPIYLDRARQTYNFVLQGEDHVGGGGIYWVEGDYGFKDSAATLQGARAALMLHQATGEPRYLTDATRLYNWAKRTTQQGDGLFMEKLFLTGPQAGTVGNFTLVNFAGFGISANLELYQSTGDAAHLREAQRIANRSLTRYFDGGTGRINDEGFWAYELVDALVDLHGIDRDPRWLDAVHDGLRWLHENKEDPNGRYGKFWGREGIQGTALASWHLNDMAPVARAYLHTALVPEPSAAGLLAVGCAWIARRGRRRTFIDA